MGGAMGCGAVKGDRIEPDKYDPASPQSMIRMGILDSDMDLMRRVIGDHPDIKNKELKEPHMKPIELAVSLGHTSAVKELLLVDTKMDTISGDDLLTVAMDAADT